MRSARFLTAQQSALPWDRPGLVAGVDEAGRGPLAGPVVAAAVILDEARPIAGLRDSKRLSARARERLDAEIRAHALCCSLGQASVFEIDELNILQATMLAMRRAVLGLRLLPHKVLVDGNRIPTLPVLAQGIVRGDALVPAISAASILAKVARDRWCRDIDAIYPQYGFALHKGYGTTRHLLALQLHGACAEHRMTFAPVAAVSGRS
jgi:ribonuclease HII